MKQIEDQVEEVLQESFNWFLYQFPNHWLQFVIILFENNEALDTATIDINISFPVWLTLSMIGLAVKKILQIDQRMTCTCYLH